MRIVLVVALVALVGAEPLAEGGGVEIKGPASVAPFKLVRMSARMPDDVGASYTWTITPAAEVERVKSPQTECVFVAPPGRYQVEVAVGWGPDTANPVQRGRKTVEIRQPAR